MSCICSTIFSVLLCYCSVLTSVCITYSLSNPLLTRRITLRYPLHSSISLDSPLVVDNDNSSSSSSSSDTSTAAAAAVKAVDTSADENASNTTISNGVIPTSMPTEGDDHSTTTVVVNSTLPVFKEGKAVGSSLNPSAASDLDRQDSMGAISWKERAIGGDDG